MKINRKGIGFLIMALFIGISLMPIIIGGRYENKDITIQDDYSYPQYEDFDYGLGSSDIHINEKSIKTGNPVIITVDVHNYGICRAMGAHGWYSSNGRSCWGEWNFNYSTSEIVDISFRCIDDVTVHWRVELDGVELASPYVPGVGSGLDHWKIVTLHNVSISEGSHNLFLGTYQMDFYPDYRLDWVEIGEIHIEAENYDRMGGNDPNSDLRGLHIYPMGANPPADKNLRVQLWEGDPSNDGILLHEDFVGDINTIVDRWHDYPGNTFEAYYIENDGIGILEYEWTPKESRNQEIFVVVDPYDVLDEINETNNIASKNISLNPPIAGFIYTPKETTELTVINFMDVSKDDDGVIVSWWWDFGDSYYSDLQNPVHCYYFAGIYEVSLTVTDNDGLTDTVQKTIEIQSV